MISTRAAPVQVDRYAALRAQLPDWEQDALRKLGQLRAEQKPAMLFVTSEGVILVFRGEKAGRIE